MSDTHLITRVVIRNYKSIGACDVSLGPLSILVGPNGSGKSNFVDALRFIADALRYSLDHALRDRGGIHEVRRRSSGHPTHFAIRIEFQLSKGRFGHYAFRIGAKRGAYLVAEEECAIHPGTDGAGKAYYRIKEGALERISIEPVPAIPKDRLFLVNVSGIEAFRTLYDALISMGFYNLNPERIREPQPPDPGELLNRDGSNMASVLATLKDRAPAVKRRVEEYLATVVPGVHAVDPKAVGPREMLEFKQAVRGAPHPWRFLATNMSDGTLRTLGVLVALFQTPTGLVAIEEPEIALHPAAASVLTDSLRDASDHRQVLITSHSPDLLDDPSLPDSAIQAVVSEYGDTKIGLLDEAGRSALRDHLYTAGELLRMDQLRPDPEATELSVKQLNLFGLDL